MAGRRAGQAGTRGPASGNKVRQLFSLGSGACSPPPLLPPLHRRSGLPPRARPGRSSERCPGAAGKPGPDCTLPPPSPPPPPRHPFSSPSLLPPPPSRRSFGHLDAAGALRPEPQPCASSSPRSDEVGQASALQRARSSPLFSQLTKIRGPHLFCKAYGLEDAPDGKSAIPRQPAAKLQGPVGRV